MEWVQVGLTALVSVLILLVEHYLPWPTWLGRRLPRTAAYVLGVLGMALPLTGLMALWGLWMVVAALWGVILTGGLAVLGAYALDDMLAMRQRLHALEIEAQLLRPEVHDDEDGSR
jgi:hypothetical protein